MEAKKGYLTITLVYMCEHHVVQADMNEYHSLMNLISQHLAIPGFGLCSGMGSCGTCVVDICDRYSKSRTSIFSCDVLINDTIANTRIYIPQSIV